jgi:hemolysin III
MLPFDLREPINAWSHGAGMIMALPVTWLLWKRCGKLRPCDLSQICHATSPCGGAKRRCAPARHHRLKVLSLLVFGLSLTFCYAASATFHGVPLRGASLNPFRRLDHIGIYLLIAGTYTPVVWSLLRGPWLWGTLATVWTISAASAAWVWYEGVLPIWVATLIYLGMGWGSLFCYRELARTYSHRTLLPLPLGGIFYTVGAIFNLARWPVLSPGFFGAHELFHLFVIAGSACHVFFMMRVVIPAPWPASRAVPVRSQPRSALLLRWARAALSRRIRRWILPILPRARWLESLLAAEALDAVPSEGPANAV